MPWKVLTFHYNSHHRFSAMKNMLVSKDLHPIPGKSTFDERWLKSVGISAALPHIANLVVDSSVSTASLYSTSLKHWPSKTSWNVFAHRYLIVDYHSFCALVVLHSEALKDTKVKTLTKLWRWEYLLSSFLWSWNDKKLEQEEKVNIIYFCGLLPWLYFGTSGY